MDQSKDKKNLKRSDKKRPQLQQQQENSASNQTSGNFEVTTTSQKGTSQNIQSNLQASSTIGGGTQSNSNINTQPSVKKGTTADQQRLAESAINVGQTPSSQLKVHSELIEYVNKLEYLVVSTKQKLLRERKAYSQIISSLALHFDSKGIRSQQVEEYIDSVVEKLRQNKEQAEEENEQLDWIQFLNNKKVENAELLQKQIKQMEQQGTNSFLSAQDGYNNSGISVGNTQSNNLSSNLQQNSKLSQNGSSSQIQQGNNQGNIIRLPMNGDDKKGSQSKRTGSNNTPQSSVQSTNKNTSSSQNNIPAQQSSIVLDADSEEPKNKKKKKPNPPQNFVDLAGIYGGAPNAQYYSQQQLLNYMAAQQQQEQLYQNQFLQAHQMNQLAQNKMNDYQQQQNNQ